MLHLFYALLNKDFNDDSHDEKSGAETAKPSSSKLQVLYITEDNTFPQITEFVNQTINRSVSLSWS